MVTHLHLHYLAKYNIIKKVPIKGPFFMYDKMQEPHFLERTLFRRISFK
jgi:hypothetical protein